VSVSLLEITNYIEHYGLQRKEISPGVYEPVSIKHSWNAPKVFQNLVLFKLQRHSDHHENSYKPYQTLCSYAESPKLPCGYGICLIAALCPPVWFSVINPLAVQANQKGVVSAEALSRGQLVLKRYVLLQTLGLTAAVMLN
jgi:alkane 1-monooxygenase